MYIFVVLDYYTRWVDAYAMLAMQHPLHQPPYYKPGSWPLKGQNDMLMKTLLVLVVQHGMLRFNAPSLAGTLVCDQHN